MSGTDTPTDPDALLAQGDFVRRVARSLLWDEHAADDVAQETWIAGLRAPAGAQRGWFAAVARNLALKRMRGDRRRASRETAAARPEAVPSEADVLERERLRRSVVDEVLALQEPYRTTILLRYFEDLPPREVARRTGVPVETVRTRTRRAIEMLRVRLAARHDDDRRAFGAALLVWGGHGPRGTGPTATGGFVMGMKTVAAAAVLVVVTAAWFLWPRPDVAPPAPPPVPDTVKPAPVAPTPRKPAEPVAEPAPSPVVAPPAAVTAVVDTGPTATLVVTAIDAATGTVVRDFSCDVGGKSVTAGRLASADGKVETVVRLATSAGDTVRVSAAAGGASGQRDVALRQGERVDVRIELQRDGEVRGQVVDTAGRPVADALVFFGEESVARGDEPFKPWDEKRVANAARTDTDGKFELRGAGRWITIWSPNAGPITVARGDAARVVLPPRGAIRGVLLSADGRPEANGKVFLDRVRETTTDAEGRFTFTGVEPGTRGLSLTGRKPKSYFAVRVAAGADVDVEMRPGIPSVQFEWPGRTNLGRAVVLVPEGPAGTMGIGEPSAGGFTVKDLLPGRYLLIGEGGAVATADVAGEKAAAIVGTGEIVVRAKPKTRVFVLPAGSSYLARLLAGRQSGAGVPADGVQRFTGLAAGRYDVGVELDGVRTTVEVKDAVVDVSVD